MDSPPFKAANRLFVILVVVTVITWHWSTDPQAKRHPSWPGRLSLAEWFFFLFDPGIVLHTEFVAVPTQRVLLPGDRPPPPISEHLFNKKTPPHLSLLSRALELAFQNSFERRSRFPECLRPPHPSSSLNLNYLGPRPCFFHVRSTFFHYSPLSIFSPPWGPLFLGKYRSSSTPPYP